MVIAVLENSVSVNVCVLIVMESATFVEYSDQKTTECHFPEWSIFTLEQT